METKDGGKIGTISNPVGQKKIQNYFLKNNKNNRPTVGNRFSPYANIYYSGSLILVFFYVFSFFLHFFFVLVFFRRFTRTGNDFFFGFFFLVGFGWGGGGLGGVV